MDITNYKQVVVGRFPSLRTLRQGCGYLFGKLTLLEISGGTCSEQYHHRKVHRTATTAFNEHIAKIAALPRVDRFCVFSPSLLALIKCWKVATSAICHHDWRFPQTDTLWNRGTAAVPVKTINNPCPAGWRVPTETELSSLTAGTVTGVWTTNYLSSSISGFLFTDNTGGPSNGNSIFLPAAGYRGLNTGEVLYSGERGYYWSSTVSGINARALGFRDGDVYVGSYYRAFGFSVRCVSE